MSLMGSDVFSDAELILAVKRAVKQESAIFPINGSWLQSIVLLGLAQTLTL